MFIEKNQRRFRLFDITDEQERREYEEILADPAIRIVSRNQMSKTDTETSSSEGQSTSNSQTRPLIALEYEELSI